MNVDVITPLPAADSFVVRVRDAVSHASDYLLYAQRTMSHDADMAWRAQQLEVDECVLLSDSRQSTKFLTLFHLGRRALVSKYLGPFEVLSRKGAVAYKLRLPASMGMFSVCFMCLCSRVTRTGAEHLLHLLLCWMTVRLSVRLRRS